MEAIREYINNVFAAYPQTSEVQTLKRDMLANMEEKYAVLRQSGKSEHEAAYNVIADFGDIKELTAELGLDSEIGGTEGVISLSWEEAQIYILKSKTSGIWIGLGVWLIIAGASSVVFLDNAFIMFLGIAAAVAMFIINGSKMGAYESYDKKSIYFDLPTRKKLEVGRAEFIPRCTAIIAIGVATIIVSVGAVTVVNFPIPLLLNVVGFSVFLFILAGSQNSAFDILLGKGDYINKKGVKKSERIIGTTAAVYWPVTTAIGLWQLFSGNSHFWAVWAVAGILFGALCAGISVWFGANENYK